MKLSVFVKELMFNRICKLHIIAKRMLTRVASEAGIRRIISRQHKLFIHSRMNVKNTLFEVRNCAFICTVTINKNGIIIRPC